MKPLNWPLATVIVAFLLLIGFLSYTGREQGALIAVGSAILAGLGVSLGQQNIVKDNVNGNLARLLNLVEGLANRLAEAPASPPRPDPADTPTKGEESS